MLFSPSKCLSKSSPMQSANVALYKINDCMNGDNIWHWQWNSWQCWVLNWSSMLPIRVFKWSYIKVQLTEGYLLLFYEAQHLTVKKFTSSSVVRSWVVAILSSCTLTSWAGSPKAGSDSSEQRGRVGPNWPNPFKGSVTFWGKSGKQNYNYLEGLTSKLLFKAIVFHLQRN